MAGPFSPRVATRLIYENPGRTGDEIVEDALSKDIIAGTLQGQRGALVKMWQAGRLPQVRRDESRRPYRYYPKDQDGEVSSLRVQPLDREDRATQVVSFRPTLKQDRVIDALVSIGVAASRTEAVQLLLEQGIAAKLDIVERALAIKAQTEELKKGMLAADKYGLPAGEGEKEVP